MIAGLILQLSIRWGHQDRQGVTICTSTSEGQVKVPTHRNQESINRPRRATINRLIAHIHQEATLQAFSQIQAHIQAPTMPSMQQDRSNPALQCTMDSSLESITTSQALSPLLRLLKLLPLPLLNPPNYFLNLHCLRALLIPASHSMELASWRS